MAKLHNNKVRHETVPSLSHDGPSSCCLHCAAVTCNTSSIASLCAANAPFNLTFSADDTANALGCGGNAVTVKSYGELPLAAPVL